MDRGRRRESDPDKAWRVNALGPRHVVDAASRVGAHVLHLSTDYVFDGTKLDPYVEWDRTNPQPAYGRSKLGGEAEVLAYPGASVVRTAQCAASTAATWSRPC